MAGLDDCLKLLRGEKDEQRLVGLLLVPKLCSNDDHDSVRKVYGAVGVPFLHRLLRTGMGKENEVAGEKENREAYIQLSVSVLAAFCRVPEIAGSEDMVANIPLVLKVMEKGAASVLEECYEFMFLTCSSSHSGVTTFFECGGLKLLASHMPSFTDGSQLLDMSLRLVILILSNITLDVVLNGYLMELSTLVASIGRQFALLQNAMKFELLRLLCVVLSSDLSVPLQNALRAMLNDKWRGYIRAGIMDILHNRVAPDQKLQALIVAESMVSMLGEHWLADQVDLPDLRMSFPSDRGLLLVFESARIEIAVLLNEVAYMKYEASSSKAEEFPLKKRNLAIAFSLVERIIKLISDLSDDEGAIVGEDTFMKVISGLDETVGVVLEYLKDAKEHGQKKGDDLLACERLVGSYLAEAPLACAEKVKELLGYLLSIEGENESSPFLSICFLLPMLCQITMKTEGVKLLTSSGGYKAVVESLLQLISADAYAAEDSSRIFLACDTIMNVLLKREHINVQLDESVFARLLKALVSWAGAGDLDFGCTIISAHLNESLNKHSPLLLKLYLCDGTNDSSIIMMASSICSLILDFASEEAFLKHPDFDMSSYHKLCHLIARSLAMYGKEKCDDTKSDSDLHQIISEGFTRWADRYPLLKNVVEK